MFNFALQIDMDWVLPFLNYHHKTMQYSFFRQNNTPSITLFFAGWGMDDNLFKKVVFPSSMVNNNDDLCMVYDYRSLQFDEKMMLPYQQITILAWSFGVWAVEQIKLEQCTYFYALNGTPQPIDDQSGIPNIMVHGTLHNLSPLTLKKFNRRMCADPILLQQFETHAPQRTIEDLREELTAIIQHATAASPFPKQWNKAWIGSHDKIFLPENQLYYWKNKGVATEILSVSHFPFTIDAAVHEQRPY